LIDGIVLAIVYDLASLPQASVALLDGGQAQGGETTTVNFASPLTDTTSPSFVAQLGLGISFSAGGSQFSNVSVNNMPLTNNAGGFDDGALANGALITVGGLGDSPANPLSLNGADDELYTLTPFLKTGRHPVHAADEQPLVRRQHLLRQPLRDGAVQGRERRAGHSASRARDLRAHAGRPRPARRGREAPQGEARRLSGNRARLARTTRGRLRAAFRLSAATGRALGSRSVRFPRQQDLDGVAFATKIRWPPAHDPRSSRHDSAPRPA
jgi:hypothetical protein